MAIAYADSTKSLRRTGGDPQTDMFQGRKRNGGEEKSEETLLNEKAGRSNQKKGRKVTVTAFKRRKSRGGNLRKKGGLKVKVR